MSCNLQGGITYKDIIKTDLTSIRIYLDIDGTVLDATDPKVIAGLQALEDACNAIEEKPCCSDICYLKKEVTEPILATHSFIGYSGRLINISDFKFDPNSTEFQNEGCGDYYPATYTLNAFWLNGSYIIPEGDTSYTLNINSPADLVYSIGGRVLNFVQWLNTIPEFAAAGIYFDGDGVAKGVFNGTDQFFFDIIESFGNGGCDTKYFVKVDPQAPQFLVRDGWTNPANVSDFTTLGGATNTADGNAILTLEMSLSIPGFEGATTFGKADKIGLYQNCKFIGYMFRDCLTGEEITNIELCNEIIGFQEYCIDTTLPSFESDTRCTAYDLFINGQCNDKWVNPNSNCMDDTVTQLDYTVSYIKVNGIILASGDTQTFTIPSTLSTSVIDGQMYNQSVSDWLNSLLLSDGSTLANYGFIGYDNLVNYDHNSTQVVEIMLEEIPDGANPTVYYYLNTSVGDSFGNSITSAEAELFENNECQPIN